MPWRSKFFLIHNTHLTLPSSSLSCVMSTWRIIVSFLYHVLSKNAILRSFCFLSLELMFKCKNLGFDTQFGFLWFVYVVVDSWIVGLNWSSQCSWVHFFLSLFRSQLWHIHYLDFFFKLCFQNEYIFRILSFFAWSFSLYIMLLKFKVRNDNDNN